MPTDRELVEDALRVWTPTFPRRVTKYQVWATSIPEAVELALDAEAEPENWPFISTYSFPNGHTKNKEIPRIDTLFIDFDISDDGEYRSGREREDAWIRDMSRLLVRTRKVAKFLLSTSQPDSWRASLSGHKGVHLFLDFEPISPSNGSFTQFISGMNSYADSVVEYLKDGTKISDIDEYVDVTSSDLGRLCRVPNTLHYGATQSFGEPRYSVPVTIEELAGIGPSDYIRLTKARRDVPWSHRTENQPAHSVLEQRIRTAPNAGTQLATAGSTVDESRIDAYEANANDVTVDDFAFLMADRPCMLEFMDRDDAFRHSGASHLMEMFCITHMMDKNIPIDTMVDFFKSHEGFNEVYTRERIRQYISRGYSPVKCETVWDRASTFCVGDGCQIWIDAHANQ